MSKVGRNDPCPCGSGKKYKKCCEQKSALQRRSFANLTPKSVTSSPDKISGMVSKRLGGEVTEGVSLADRFSKTPPKKEEEEKPEPESKEPS